MFFSYNFENSSISLQGGVVESVVAVAIGDVHARVAVEYELAHDQAVLIVDTREHEWRTAGSDRHHSSTSTVVVVFLAVTVTGFFSSLLLVVLVLVLVLVLVVIVVVLGDGQTLVELVDARA